MKTLIRNGNIITAENEFVADILIDGEKIAAIGKDLKADADQIVDATGKYVFPGGIDQHTHFDALCNVGNTDTAPYETSKAVCVGGTTPSSTMPPRIPAAASSTPSSTASITGPKARSAWITPCTP